MNPGDLVTACYDYRNLQVGVMICACIGSLKSKPRWDEYGWSFVNTGNEQCVLVMTPTRYFWTTKSYWKLI